MSQDTFKLEQKLTTDEWRMIIDALDYRGSAFLKLADYEIFLKGMDDSATKEAFQNSDAHFELVNKIKSSFLS